MSYFVLFSILEARTPRNYFWRLHFGTGLGTFSDKPKKNTAANELEFEGQAGIFGLKLGYMNWRRTSIDLAFTSIRDNNPNIKRGGVELEDVSGAYGIATLGLGISQFFGSFYISPEFRYVVQAVEEFGGTKTTFKGVGVGVSLGTEWRWTSAWDMGVCLTYISDSLEGVESGPPNEPYEGKGTHTFYGIGLSLTYD